MVPVPRHDWTPLRIRELRVRMGKTQGEFARLLAEMAGGRVLHRSRVAMWEGGFNRPRLHWLPYLDDLDTRVPRASIRNVDYQEVIRGGN